MAAGRGRSPFADASRVPAFARRRLCTTMEVMKPQRRLIVMRHGKAGDLPGGPDIERALRPRGRRDATAAGRWLAGRGVLPDLVLCSKARRARQTWQHVAAELGGAPRVVNDPRLYSAGADELLGIVGETAPEVTNLMYVGHNPAAAELADVLTGEAVDFPTSAIAVIGLAVPWSELEDAAAAARTAGAGALIAAWKPRDEAA
jgi:phosphohistidine phosphatase